MKVLVVIDSMRLGGAERLVATLARMAGEAGFELEVASLSGRPGAGTLADRIAAAGVEPQSLGLKRLVDPAALPALAGVIRESGCDVVHAHLDESIILASIACRVTARPLVCTLHTPWLPGLSLRSRIVRRTAVRLAAGASAFVFVSRASLGSYAARCRRRENWIVVPNGVDLDDFHPGRAPFPPDIVVPPGTPTALVVGRLDSRKGVLEVVEAWPRIREAVPAAMLVLAGTAADGTRLEQAVADAGVSGNVVFAGLRDDIPDLMRASDVVLLPTWADALPTMLMEAGACGRPVVSTVVGGVPEIVEHGVSGLLVFPGDRTGIADAVSAVLSDPELAARMGRAGRDIVTRRFDGRDWARRLRRVYEAASEGSPVPSPDLEIRA